MTGDGGDDLARECREALQTAWDYDRDNRREAQEDLNFIAGFQWPDAARQARLGRPIITINRSTQFLHMVTNPIRQSMPVIKVQPVDDRSPPMLQDTFNGLLRQIQYESSATHVYASAVEHCVGCGIGWMRVLTDYVDDDGWDLELMIERVPNPLSVYCDPGATRLDRSDAAFMVISEMMPQSTFKRRWPKAAATGMPTPRDVGTQQQIVWSTADQIRVAEYWKREPSRRKIALLQNGSTVALDNIDQSQWGQMGIQTVREVASYKVTSTLLSGVEPLEETHPWPGKWIPLVPVVGSEIPLERGMYRHGLIRFQREPQQLHNFFMSSAAEALGQQPKAPYLVTPKQIGKFKSQWDNANTSAQPYLLYEPDAETPGGQPTRVVPPAFPVGLVQFGQMLSDDMKATTGIYDAALGAQSNETSGVAIGQRVAQGQQSTMHFSDNLEHALDHLGRMLVDLIPKVYDTQRMLRIVGEDDTDQQIPINVPTGVPGPDGLPMIFNDLSAARFDVHVSISKNVGTAKQEAIQTLMQFVQAFPPAAPLVGDLVARNLDTPLAQQLAARLKSLLPPAVQQEENPPPPGPPPPPPPQMQHQIAVQASIGESTAAKAQAEAALNFARVQREHLSSAAENERIRGIALDNALKLRRLSEPNSTAN
jgi:hypothetical protein